MAGRTSGPRDRLRNLLLHREHVLESSVVAVRPDHTLFGIHQLYSNPEPVPGTPDASFEHVLHVQQLADGANAEPLPLERKRRRSAGDGDSLDLAENADELVGKAVAEMLILGIAAGIHHRQYSHRSANILLLVPRRRHVVELA